MTNTDEVFEVAIADIYKEGRVRKDMGDIAGLAKSIQENGLIEPIVLTIGFIPSVTPGVEIGVQEKIKLVAGERRLTALKLLGIHRLKHAEHFIWRSELRSGDAKTRLLAQSIEMEENLRRKDLTWVEQIEGKQRLLAIMQEVYGPPSGGAPSRDERLGLKSQGFGVRKLAEMLGESAAQTSEDLEMAALVDKIPVLKNEPSREAAKRLIDLAVRTSRGLIATKIATPLVYKILIECISEQHQLELLEKLRKEGLKCQTIVA